MVFNQIDHLRYITQTLQNKLEFDFKFAYVSVKLLYDNINCNLKKCIFKNKL